MSNKIVYRREKGSQLTSNEVDGNFKYLDQRIDKVSEKDYFIYDAGYSKNNNQITINKASKWKISGEEYSNVVDFIFDIRESEKGLMRIDVITANVLGEFDIVKGVEGNGYHKPVVGNALPYLYVYVSDRGIQSVGTSAMGDYVSKLNYGWHQVDLKESVLSVTESTCNVDIVGGNLIVENIANGIREIKVSNTFPDGYEVSIKNSRSSYLTIVNGDKIKVYTGHNYTVRPGEIIVFKYNRDGDCFEVSGALDIRLDMDNVDEVIGVDVMRIYIDSSTGDALNPNDLNTVLTPTVMRYFKDYNHQAVGWQWKRYSGNSKEEQEADAAWAIGKTKRVLALSPEDFTNSIHKGNVSFIVECVVNNQVITGVWVAKLVDQAKTVRIQSTGTQFKGQKPEYIMLKAVVNNFKHSKIEWLKDGKLVNVSEQFLVYGKDVDSYAVYELKVTDLAGNIYQDTLTISKVADGKDGVNGESGAVPIWTEWMTGDKHYNNSSEIYYIYHRPTDTVWKLKDGNDNVTAPVNPDNRYVQQPHLQQVLARVLIAEGANIAGFIFKDGKLISQSPNLTNPNIVLDGNTGKAILRDAEITGRVTIGPGSPALDTIDQKVKEGVDGLQVGGRNYLMNSTNIKLTGSDRPTTNNISNRQDDGSFRITSTGTGGIMSRYNWLANTDNSPKNNYITDRDFVKGGYKLMLSMKVRSNSDNFYVRLDIRTPQAKSPIIYVPKTDEFVRIEIPLVVERDEARKAMLLLFSSIQQVPKDHWVEYKELKLELGDKSTDWTPAPEDLEAQITDQEIYIEYSKDGATNWHYPAKTDDVFYRQKKGNGAWSANIRIAGVDGKNGSNGKDGKYQVQQYAKNTSLTISPTAGWVDVIPTASADEYIWMRTGDVVPPATAPTSWKPAIRITGNRGADGKDGSNGKDGQAGKFSIYNFAKNTSLTTAPTTGWVATPPAISATEYLWQRIGDVIPPATAPTTWSAAVRISGPAGANGKDGVKGADGKNGTNGSNGKDGKYVVVQFAKNSSFTTAPTTGWSTNQPTITDKEYLWMRTGEVTPPATATTAWKTATRISGIHGQDGEDIKGVNLLSIKHLNEDKYIDTNGKEINNSTDFVAYLDYQEVIPTKPYYVGYFAIGAVNGGDSSSIDIFYYNASKAFISKQTFDNDKGQGIYQPKKLTIPASAKYVRFNFWNNANEYGLRIKLEQSDVATPYSPSYEDFGSALAPLQQTEILGGTITTGILGVSNNNKDIVAGLTGEGFSSNTDTVIWAGATHDKKHLAPFQVKADGSIIANNGKFTGEIDVKSGIVDGFLKVGAHAGINAGKKIFSSGEGEYYEEWGENIVFYVGEEINIPESEADRYLHFWVSDYGYLYANSGQIGHWELGDEYLFNRYNEGVIVGASSYRGGGIRNHQYVNDEHMYAVKIDDYPLSTKTRNLPEDKVKRDFGYIDIVGSDMYYDSIEDKVHPPAGISLKNAVISGFGVKTHIEYTNARNIQDEETVIFDNNSAVLVVEMPRQQYVWEGKKVTIKALYPNSVLEVWIGAGKGFISYYGLSSPTKLTFGGKGVCVTMIYANEHWIVLHNTNWP